MQLDSQDASLAVDISSPSGDSLAATHIHSNGFHEPTIEELERELPMVYDGQIHLGDLLSRVVQAIYAELSELAET
jgi:mediator of RNA polymerase II transcription subunit 14